MARPQTLQQSLPGLLRVVGRFRFYIFKELPLIAGSLLALFAGIGLRLLEPWPLQIVIDHVIGLEPGGWLAGLLPLDALDPVALLTLSALSLVVIAGLRALADYGHTVGFALIGNRVTTQVRNKLYRHLQLLSLSFHTQARGGDLVVRVIGDVNMLRDVAVTALLPLIANMLILVGMLAFMFWLQWELALVAMATVPLFWLLTLRFSRRIHHFFRIDSTNNVALALAADGEPHGALVLAEEQTAGRGRLGRSWYSEKASGIYLSLILRPQLAVQQAPLLTLVAGLAARDAVVEATGLAVDIRWPNDLLVNGKKFCGILTEMQAEADRVRHVVVGIGVNVNHTRIPAELESIATSLQLAGGRPCSRLELVAGLLRAFDGYYNSLLNDGAAPLIARFGEVSSYAQGKRVRVTAPREEFIGTTAGLDSMGCLLIRRDDGEVVPVLAGDIRET